MATLTIRNVDATVKEQLRVRAARNGRSMEAELRAIVTEAVGGERIANPILPRRSAAASSLSAVSMILSRIPRSRWGSPLRSTDDRPRHQRHF